MAAGTTYKQCGCREGGKRLGRHCPKLRRGNGTWSPVHGRWYYQLELPPRADGRRGHPCAIASNAALSVCPASSSPKRPNHTVSRSPSTWSCGHEM
jgi:hypothetical protein